MFKSIYTAYVNDDDESISGTRLSHLSDKFYFFQVIDFHISCLFKRKLYIRFFSPRYFFCLFLLILFFLLTNAHGLQHLSVLGH